MDDFICLQELARLEQELSSLPKLQPGADCVSGFWLSSRTITPLLASMKTMEYVVALAAAVLLIANLS